ncbi:hypothetical protein PVAND_001082 [Polypedilum vanderplanki]|uniref:Uncharacterized protein n=1 Tax=Polypedilum vanderplanki TaxID=319348 RepID=A0A9J6BM98_POLVA|nr:hypothetical protein PVAND_001082 [Polypedilum vanderplanki]
MFEAGLMKYFYDIWLYWRFLKEHFCEKNERKALTVKDLGYGFNIFLITCAFSIMIFFIEIIVSKFKIWKQNRKEKLNLIQNVNNESQFDDIDENSIENKNLIQIYVNKIKTNQEEFVEEPNETMQNCSIKEDEIC